MDQKLLMLLINKDVAALSPWLQYIILHIHKYSVIILYKPGPNLYIVYWSSHNNMENKYQKITGMNINVHTIISAVDILMCTSKDIKAATARMQTCNG